MPPEEVEDYRQLDKKIKKEILKRYRDYLDWRERNFILDGVYVSNLSVAYSKANPKLKFAMPPYNALLDPASHTYFRQVIPRSRHCLAVSRLLHHLDLSTQNVLMKKRGFSSRLLKKGLKFKYLQNLWHERYINFINFMIIFEVLR